MNKNNTTFFEKEIQNLEQAKTTFEEYWIHIWSGVIENNKDKVIKNIDLLTKESYLEKELIRSEQEINKTPSCIKKFIIDNSLNSIGKRVKKMNVLGIASLFLDSSSLEEYVHNFVYNTEAGDFEFKAVYDIDFKILSYRAIKEDDINLIKCLITNINKKESELFRKICIDNLCFHSLHKNINYPKNCISFFIENNITYTEQKYDFLDVIADNKDTENIEKFAQYSSAQQRYVFSEKIYQSILENKLEKANYLEEQYYNILNKKIIKKSPTEKNIIFESFIYYIERASCSNDIETEQACEFLKNFSHYIEKYRHKDFFYHNKDNINWGIIEKTDKNLKTNIFQSFIEKNILLNDKKTNNKKSTISL